MLDKIRKKLNPEKTNEFDQLIKEASRFPRYTDHVFKFLDYKLKVTDFISVAYQLKEYFEDQRLKFISENKEPRIIDCGSNIGISLLYFKNIFPHAKILGFEPDPKIFDCLTENLHTNKITDITLEKKAIWINNDGIEFGSEGADGGSLFFSGNKIKVPTIRLKEILEKETAIDLLKIDIEGAELKVLEDCNEELKKVKFLFVEYHSWINNTQELDKLLNTLTRNSFRYYIHSIGQQTQQPFITADPGNGMDVQLDIYAVNEHKSNII